MMLNKMKLRDRIHIVEVVFISISLFCVADLAMAETTSAWSCGAWVTDKNDSCKEVKKCTRTSCSTKGKIDNCVTETQTSTATKANCPPLNTKPGAGRFTKGMATSGTMTRPPSTTPKRTAPTISNPVLQPRAIVNSPKAPKPTTGRGVKPATNMGATTKPSQKGKPKTKVKMPINKNTTSLPYSRNISKTKQPVLFAVPVVRTNKPQHNNLVVPEIKNSGASLSKQPSLSSGVSRKPVGKGFVPVGNANAKPISNVSDLEKPRYTGMDDIISEASIYKDEFDNVVWERFSRIRPKLSNYGPRVGNSWYKANASYMDFDGAFGLSKHVFSIPAFNATPFSYYVNEIYSGPMQEINGGPMLWNLVDMGSEVKGHCAASSQCNDGDDRSASDISVSNNLSLYLIPDMVVRNGSLSFSTLNVKLYLDFNDRNTSAACNAIGNNFNCSLLRNYENTIKNKVELELRNVLEQTRIKDAVASRMRYVLDRYRIKEVISAEIQGDRIKIKYRKKNGQMAIP